jgi:PPP family 3-phenylpropionic acid transporter
VLALRVLFLLGGAVLGTFYPFVAVLFADRGFDPAEIGLVTAAGSLVFSVTVPVWGHLADVRLGRSGALRLAGIGAALSLVAFGLPWPPLVLAAMYIAFAGTESAFGPLADAIGVNALRHPEREYAALRLLSSLGFAIVAIACGQLFEQTGYWPATLLFALLSIGLAVSAGFTPDRPKADLAAYGRKGRGGSVRVAFAVQPRLPVILVAVGLFYIGVLGGFTFLGLRIVELGGGPSEVALSAGIAALAEVPAMLIAGRLAPRIGLRWLFTIGVLVYVACIVSWIVITSPLVIVATRIPSGFGFSAVWIAAVLTMQRLLPARLQGTGQGLFQMTAFGVSAIVANLVGGLLYGSLGSGVFFAVIAVVTAAATIVGWAAIPGRRDHRPVWPDDADEAVLPQGRPADEPVS